MTENTYNFSDYKIQDVFYQFYTSGKTGVIKVFFPMNIVKTVYFSEGNIVFATSNSEKDKLTTILIKNKKITKEQLNMALKQMDKSISLGRNLVNMGLITHKELVWAVKIQVLSIVFSILMLKEGEYTQIEGFLPEGIIKLPFNTLKILFDSLLLFKDKEWISEQISSDMVFKKTPYFDEYKEKILPDSTYEKIYELIDGNRSVGEITGMVDIEDFKVYKLFYALKFLKLIEEATEEIEDAFTIAGEEIEFEQEDEIYKVKGDDTENIKMVEDLIGDKDNEEDVAIEFEGGLSEQSAFEEDLEEKFPNEKQQFEEDGEMDSIVLDESDFVEGDRALELEENKETVVQEKKEYLEKLQQQLENEGSVSEDLKNDGFKLEFEEKEEESERTIPVSSPYETARQEIKPEFVKETQITGEAEESFVVEEEYVESKDSGMGLYLVLILLLFIAALGYLGYDYYTKSLNKGAKRYSRPKETVKVVKKSGDITAEDITIKKIEEKMENEGEKGKKPETTASETNKTKVSEEVAASEETTPNYSVEKENKGNDISEDNKQQQEKTIKEPVSYEAVPVYGGEEKKSGAGEVSETVATVNKEDYKEFISNSKNTLIQNPEAYTIQLELACQKETVDKAIELLPQKDIIFFIPAKFKGTTCFIICYGMFNTMDEAKVALKTLDGEFFQDNTPLIKKAADFKRYF